MKKENQQDKAKESLVDIAKKAKDAGMTYGQYVAMTEYGKKVKR